MRAVRTLVIMVVVLGGLFVAADRVAVHIAESKAADNAQQTQGLSEKPEVSIHGFPFLTQVADQKLDDVTVTAKGVTADTGESSLRIERFTADLRGVRLSDGFASAVADGADGSALITYEDLTKAAPDGVVVSYGGEAADGKGKVKVTASVSLPLVGTVKRTVVSRVSVIGGDTVKVHADSIPGGEGLPSSGETLIRDRIDFERKLPGLPEGIRLTSVETAKEGVTVSATGTDVVLAE